MASKIPVIDIFAGPGGLGEGFARAGGFDVRLSCEMDETACRTLRLRKFFHLATGRERIAYYEAVKQRDPDRILAKQFPDLWAEAEKRVLNIRLGDDTRRAELHRRIREATGGGDFVLIGGPPCQAYSLVGRSRRLGMGALSDDKVLREQRQTAFYQDEKHRLYREYLEILAVHRPAVFVMENVKGLASARTAAGAEIGSVSQQILQDLRNPFDAVNDGRLHAEVRSRLKREALKYHLVSLSAERESGPDQTDLFAEPSIRDFVLRSEVYGVPQARHRVIIVGIRDDLAGNVRQLKQTEPQIPARTVLEGMPPLRSHLSKGRDDAAAWLQAIREEVTQRLTGTAEIYGLGIADRVGEIAASAAQRNSGAQWIPKAPKAIKGSDALRSWLSDPKLEGVLQHRARGHMTSDLARYLFCAAYAAAKDRSPKLIDWPEKLLPAHRNVSAAKDARRLADLAFADRFKVQGSGDQPASTVTSHIAKDGHYYIHPDPVQCRSLTVREAARLQTFPDNYFFCGNRTQQYHQVGNAVPSYLAKQIAERISAFLRRAL